MERRFTYGRVCHCGACRARDAAAFSGIVAANYSPRERRELERIDRGERIAELERALLAPAAAPRATGPVRAGEGI